METPKKEDKETGNVKEIELSEQLNDADVINYFEDVILSSIKKTTKRKRKIPSKYLDYEMY